MPARTPDERSALIEHMDREQFRQAVETAKAEAAHADHVRDTLVLWERRLRPYLEAEPALTIAEAMDRFLAGERRY